MEAAFQFYLLKKLQVVTPLPLSSQFLVVQLPAGAPAQAIL
jgi:hypothetical protein